MSVRIKVSVLRTRPYEPSDLEHMVGEEYKKFASGYYEKVQGEDVLEEFDSDNLALLGDRITQIVESNTLRPLIITSSNADEIPLKHSFLIQRSYVPVDDKRAFELIVYAPKDQVAWQKKLDQSAREWEAKRLSPSEQQEFMQKAIKQVVEETANAVTHFFDNSPGGTGFESVDEVRSIYAELRSKRGDFATDEEFANYFVSEFGKRTDVLRVRHKEELVRKPPYYASKLPSILNDDMEVLCRIVGKDKEPVYKHLEYYKSLYGKPKHIYSVDNDADDGMHASFVYGKNSGEKDTE